MKDEKKSKQFIGEVERPETEPINLGGVDKQEWAHAEKEGDNEEIKEVKEKMRKVGVEYKELEAEAERLQAAGDMKGLAEVLEKMQKLSSSYLTAMNEYLLKPANEDYLFGDKQKDRMVRMNLGANVTMNYSRINLTETLLAFNFNKEHTLNHWRMSKVMDGIVICAEELKICGSLDPNKIPELIYQPIKEGKGADKGNGKGWKLKLTNPDTGEVEENHEASLADFANFMNIYDNHKALSTAGRMKLDRLVYNFFTGKELKVTETNVDENGNEKQVEIDLRKQTGQETDFKDIKIDDFINTIKEHQAGFQFMGSFRYISQNHRENAGQSYFVPMAKTIGGVIPCSLWIPNSGRLAAEVSSSDLRKMEKVGPDGHPHEVAEIDEDNGGSVRFRYHDLKTQRRNIGDPPSHSRTNIRMYRAAVGLSSAETGHVELEEKTNKKKIYLGGKFEQQGNLMREMSESHIIKSMHKQHDEMRRYMGLNKLSDAQASDMFVTDAIAPFFLNNKMDWLMCLAIAYDVSGTGTGSNKRVSITSSIDKEWKDFELRIVCKDILSGIPKGTEKGEGAGTGDGKIKELVFTNFRDFESYIIGRHEAGHIDQHIDVKVARQPESTKTDEDNKYTKAKKVEKLDEDKAGKIRELFGSLFEGEYNTILQKYAGAEEVKDILEVHTALGQTMVPGQKQGRTSQQFKGLLLSLLSGYGETNQQNFADVCMAIIGIPVDASSDEDRALAVDALVEALVELPKEERQKLLSIG